MNIGFSVKDTVESRYSVRTYDKRAVDENTRKKLMEYAASIKNPFGPKVRFKLIDKEVAPNGEKLGTYGFISGATLFIGVAVPDENYAAEAVGYEFEQLVLFSQSLGLGTCWLGGTFNRGAFAQAMQPAENEHFPIVSPVGYAKKNLRIIEKVFRSKLKADNRVPWETVFFDGGFSQPLPKDKAGDYAFPLEMLRLAPSAENKQPWRVVFADNAFHFFAANLPDDTVRGIRMKRIDSGIAACHFHLAASEKGLNGKFERLESLNFDIPENTAYITSWIVE